MSRIAWFGMSTVLVVVFAGCDSNEPKLYKVVGKVTMDGEPLPNAEVRFLPIPKRDEPVRPSSATTDENGEYSLEYSSTKSGARPGSYQVYVSTKRNAMPDVPAVPESVPDVYNTKSTLAAEIDEESRTFNFELKSSEGKIPERRTPPPAE
jgi:hypothetical protein